MYGTRGKGPRSGFNLNMYVNQAEASKFICEVCTGILNNPKQCKNGHAFCFGCVEQWLEDNHKCPTCRIRLISDDLSTCLMVNNMIKDLHVHCNCLDEDIRREGCEWTGTLEARNRRDCNNLYGDCPFAGCGVSRVPLANMEVHKQKCQKRLVLCGECDTNYPFDESDEHPASCVARLVECECETLVHFSDLAAHQRFCDLKLVPCVIFQEFGMCVPGCSGTTQKRHQWKHLGQDSVKLITTMHARYMKLKVVMSVCALFFDFILVLIVFVPGVS